MIKKITTTAFLVLLFAVLTKAQVPDSIDISVTYQVDMELEILKGGFDPASDTVEVRGSFFGWGSEAPDMVQDPINPNLYTHTATQKATVGDSLPAYKFYYTVGNWEGGSDKYYQITQEDYDNGYAVVARPFNDATLDDVINQDATILFTVNTAGAISSINNSAFTAVNTVHVTGAVQPLKWPDGGWPDAQIDRMIALYDDGTNGDANAGDGIFSKEVVFPQYTSFRIQYKYGINYGDAGNNQGGNDNENGVGADHFIEMTADLVYAKVENTFGQMGDHEIIVTKPDSIDISVTYQVDMELEILKGGFNPASDTVEVRGSFFGWGSEAPDMVQDPVNPNLYTHTATQKATVGDSLPAYKFYYTVGNWEGGSDKYYRITQADYNNGYAVVARPFNDATLDDVINQDATILFTVNTAGAISSINNSAFTAVNTVHVTGAVQPLKWPDGGWPDAQIDRMIALFDDGTNGDVTAGDGIFSKEVVFPQYTSFRIQYKYGINYGDATNNQGGNDNENGVGADHFIEMTANMSYAKVENTFGQMGDHSLVEVQTTGVEQISQLPSQYELSQNYPNPFNPSTTIRFQIPESNFVTLKVFNMLGQEVGTLVNEQMNAGVYEANFDASKLSSGVYIYTISVGKFVSSHKMLLLK